MWLKRLDAEHDNLQTAFDWSMQQGDKEAALRMVAALPEFWHTRGYLNEGSHWIERALMMDGAAPQSLQARVLTGAGMVACDRGDYERGQGYFSQGLALYRELDNRRGVAAMLANLGTAALRRDDYERAAQFYEEGLTLSRTLGEKVYISTCLANLGNLALSQGALDRARSLYQESLALRRGLEDHDGIALTIRRLGAVAVEEGNYERAKRLFEESLALLSRLGNKVGIAACLEGLARVAGREGHHELAVRLWSVADSARSAAGAPLSPLKQRLYDPEIAMLREALGASAFAGAWLEGRTMPLEQAAEYALGRAVPA
jgi:tetratricopeptide (TPR) repeat protein